MEEEEFKKSFRAAAPLPCVFEKALLTRCAECARAKRIYIAEREGVSCLSPAAQQRCVEWFDLVRRNSRFAVGLAQAEGVLPHAKALRLQCGGLLGLRDALEDGAGKKATVEVAALLGLAQQRAGGMQGLDFQTVVKQVSHYPVRTRRGSRRA